MRIRLVLEHTIRSLLAACAALACGPALAALTDVSTVPLASASEILVKPNILLILDNSGSMESLFMPDDVSSDTGRTGFRNSQCNTMYYNPATTYALPKNADGTDFAAATFTSAKTNGYNAASSSTNLSTSFKAHSSDTAQAAYYWVLTGGAALTPHQGACLDAIASSATTSIAATGGGTWDKVTVSATSGPGASDERVNFANWYSYYRTRMMMMKAAVSRVFAGVSDSYRVGFLVIEPYASVESSEFVPIADFDATQKTTWFSTLFSQVGVSYTPLRRALSRAGRYFAGVQDGINSGMSDDPVQYSCQQNFAILTTDGYWNSSAGQKIDGSAMDNQDGDIAITPPPLYDGTLDSITDTTVSRQYSFGGFFCGFNKKRIYYTDTTTRTVTTYSAGGSVVSGPTTTTTVSGPQLYSATCYTIVNPANPVPNPLNLASNPVVTFTPGVAGTSGGSSGSLADVAQYYYRGPYDRGNGLFSLRQAGSTGALGTDVGTECNVPGIGLGVEADNNPCQHMTTFTLGLGLAGTIGYQQDYKTATTGDFKLVREGNLNWPTAVADQASALDDLWHAAVNGRGTFFSAADPDSVVTGLSAALANIESRVSSAAAAATSNLEPVAGDNFAYVGKFTTKTWDGDIEAHEIDLTTGVVQTPVIWSAQAKLNTTTAGSCDTRNIKLFRAGATGNLVNFTWNTYGCDAGGNQTGSPDTGLNGAEQANFGASAVTALTQSSDMTNGGGGSFDQITAARGENLVNFLRGQRGHENFVPGDAIGYYRARTNILGDIVNAQPVYVRAPFANYSDKGYDTYKSTHSSRTPMVYVAANDGMLHAFFAGTSVSDLQGGVEAWAFIPTVVLPKLYKLADNNYENLHTWYTDGTPTIGDVCTADCAVADVAAATWKTILVGGFNGGGKGYYALDVTDPVNPKGLWELKHSNTCFDPGDSATFYADCHLGLSYGNPIISKLSDGRWVVFVTSGYNNVNSPSISGDGEGYLYVLEANTGKILYKIGTNSGSSFTPSGLNKITNWVDATLTNNATLRVYGVDLRGNVWRFDVNDTINPAGREATRIATARDPDGVRQPITTRPELAEIGSPPEPFVYVATGRYLGTTDIPEVGVTAQVQSLYAIHDPLNTTAYASLRTSLREQTITNVGAGGTSTRTVSCTGNCNSLDGWFVDFPDNGERVNVDMKLQLGTLVVATNVPNTSACAVGGYSWLNYFDFRNGAPVATSPGGLVGQRLADSLVVGLNIVRLPSGKTVVIATNADARQRTIDVPFDTPAPTGRRISWREVAQ
ncbi:MAG: hypothetical protein IT514_03430 [Burkholderiales bacterium]|nr:hypothetical protein [Burkholderiales bacterium]